jgi:hypothetical protein
MSCYLFSDWGDGYHQQNPAREVHERPQLHYFEEIKLLNELKDPNIIEQIDALHYTLYSSSWKWA